MSVQGLNGEQCLFPSGPGFLSKIGTVLSLINKAGYFIGHLKVLVRSYSLLAGPQRIQCMVQCP